MGSDFSWVEGVYMQEIYMVLSPAPTVTLSFSCPEKSPTNQHAEAYNQPEEATVHNQ